MQFNEILDQYGIPHVEGGQHRHVREGWIGFDCPFCSSGSGKYHAGFNVEGGWVVCWRCGSHRLADTVAELTKEPLFRCFELLKDLSFRVQRRQLREPTKLRVPKGLGPLLPAHRRYLKGRGFDPDELEQLWGLRGIGIASRLAWRIWIPIHYRGELVSWTTRAIGNGGLRYVNAGQREESKSMKSLLYGHDFAGHSVVVVEGPADVWRIGPGAVATLGLQTTEDQASLISQFPRRAICFDNEPVAQLRASRLSRQLRDFEGETVVVLLGRFKDAGEADDKTIETIRELMR